MKLPLMDSFVLGLLAPVLLAARTAPGGGVPAEHAVLFIIDGLSYKAVERLPLKNLQALIAAGAYYEKSYNVLPAHPKTGEWARLHRSSIPNPVILAGTVLLRADQQYVQQSFFPSRITAHAANSVAYEKLNVGFHLSFQDGSDDRPMPDDQTMAWAIEFLRRARPAFMKLHLQDTGSAGSLSYEETNPLAPWRRNIWAEGSPYIQAAVRADEHLGRFLEELKALGLREKTVLFVTADHGQSDGGWHPYDDEDGWAMPLVLAGPGIVAGRRFEYAEQIDIVPTLCFLMGVRPPANADGRILAEALAEPPGKAPPRRQQIKELNELLKQGDAWIKKLRQDAEKSPSRRARLAEAERDFYGLERILEWRRFGALDKLLAHNRNVLKRVSDLRGRK